MRKPSRHPLITLLVVFAFLAQVTGISGCAEADKAYKQATGQTVVDDGTVRSKLEVVNQMSDNTYNQFSTLVDQSAEAGRRADAGDIDGAAAIMINSIPAEVDALLATVKELGAAEEIIKNQTDAARSAGPQVSPDFCFDPLSCLALATAAYGIVKFAQFLKKEAVVVSESKGRKETAVSQANLEGVSTENKILNNSFHKVTNEGASQVVKVLAGAAKPVIGAGTLIVTTAGNYLIDPNKTPKLKIFGGSKQCADLTPGDPPSSNGCKVVYGEVPTSTKTVTVAGIPAGNLDMTMWAKDIARLVMKDVAIAQSAITTLLRELIAISDATAKNIKANDAGTYTPPSAGGGTTTPASGGTSASFPREYKGSGPLYASTCTTTMIWDVTLLADGTISATSTGDAGTCWSGGNMTHSGTHSSGSFIMNSADGTTTSGTYDEKSITGSGSASLGNGVSANWSFTLPRK
jgi:hypothetical protein